MRSSIGIATLCLAIAAPAAAEETSANGAIVSVGDRTFELRIHGMCGAGADGAYNFWAVTPDEEEPSVAKKGGPRLHAFSNGEWSVLEFRPGGDEPAMVVRAEGENRTQLADGMLHYAGPATEGTDEKLDIRVRC